MEIEGFGDLFGDYSESESIVDESIFSEAAESSHKAMNNVRNLIIGLVGIAILFFLIKIVIKKMNESRK